MQRISEVAKRGAKGLIIFYNDDKYPFKTVNPSSRELIVEADFSIDTKFERIDTDDFIFMFRKDEVDSDLVAKLADINQQSISFISEGFARYTEALATDKELNDRATYNYLQEGKLYSLEEMLDFNIGQTGPKTDIGYPAE